MTLGEVMSGRGTSMTLGEVMCCAATLMNVAGCGGEPCMHITKLSV